MTDNSRGYYLVTLWAGAGSSNPASVRSYVKNTYGEAAIDNLGMGAKNLNFGAFSKAAADAIGAGASSDNPTMADLFTASLAAGGAGQSVFTSVAKGLGDTATTVTNFSLSSLKVIAVVAVVLGTAYILYSTGALRARRA